MPRQTKRNECLLNLSLHPSLACRRTSIQLHGSDYSVSPNSIYRFFDVFVVSNFVCVHYLPQMILLNRNSELVFLEVPCYLLTLNLGRQMRMIKDDLNQMLNAYYLYCGLCKRYYGFIMIPRQGRSSCDVLILFLES